MESNAIPYAAWAGNIVFLGLGIWVIKSSLGQTRTDMKEGVANMHKSIKGVYDAIHKHGHRGLDGNGNDVTRGD